MSCGLIGRGSAAENIDPIGPEPATASQAWPDGWLNFQRFDGRWLTPFTMEK